MPKLAVCATPNDLNDADALRLYARHGDPDAFLLLVTRYQAMVFATCRRSLSNPADAEDATQETFFRLAQQARAVRTNVAAWLHRCAVGTSIDVARRSRASRRAEARAASHAEGTRSERSTADLRWSEVAPLVDRALAELADDDRDLVVARYLAGRSQVDLAREQGVAESTVSRRLARAVGRLREALGASGLSIATSAVLLGALDSAAHASVPAETSASLGRIAISGVRGQARSAGVLWPALVAAGLLLAVAAISAVLLQSTDSSDGAEAGLPATLAVDSPLGPPAPRRTIGPFQVVTASDRNFQERGIWIDRDAMSVRHGYTEDGEPRRATLQLLSVLAIDDDPATSDLRERALIEARVSRLRPMRDEYSRFTMNDSLTLRYSTDDAGRIVLEDTSGEVQLGRNEPRWYGVRPPSGWPERLEIPDDAGAFGLWGPWTEAERIPVTIDSREINFGADLWSAARYRIIEWERVEGWSRVLSIQAGGRDPTLIGTRFRLLIRRDEHGYSIAYYPPESAMSGRWPSSFDYSKDNPVLVVSFEEPE